MDDSSATTTNNNNNWNKNAFGSTVPKQKGKFSREESDLVRKAVEDYCASKQITAARLCSEFDHKAELKGAWMEIAKRLPHRSVQSVYRHGIRKLHPFKRGTWSEEEVILLQDLVQKLGKKWSAIQSKLHRSADSCRDKYREIQEDYAKGHWTDDEIEQLKKLIREFLRIDDPDMDMKEVGKLAEDNGYKIPWSTISKRMGKRSRLACYKKWQKLTGLLSPSDEHRRVKITIPPPLKAIQSAPTAGAAAAMAAAAAAAYEEDLSAKMADETVEAVGLPDTEVLTNQV